MQYVADGCDGLCGDEAVIGTGVLVVLHLDAACS